MTFTTQPQTEKLIVRVVADCGTSGEGFVDDIQLVKSLTNASFENDSKGWNLRPNMSINSVSAKDGSKSLKFNSDTSIEGTSNTVKNTR